MKISHEVPLSLLEKSREFCDFDYALVHLFETNKEYLEFFKKSLRLGRTVYLDNSVFELGESFDHDRFAYWVKELGEINRDNFYYIIPDSLNEKNKTISNYIDFVTKYPNLPGKSIGVVQGETYNELIDCYEFMSSNSDMVAISFGYSWFQLLHKYEENKFFAMMKGRQNLIDLLIEEGFWNHNKPHHLLGCSLPQEFMHYSNIPSIVSVDTSNPIVMGMLGHRYNETEGLRTKENIKLVDLFESKLTEIQLDNIYHNISIFKGFVL